MGSSSVEVVLKQTYPAKTENGTCTTASVHLNSIETAKFRLLSLPIELRRMIYRHYFHDPLEGWRSSYRRVDESKYCNIYCLKKCHTQILSVNHQIHDEAIEFLYADTLFHFSFNSFVYKTRHKTVDCTFLRGFRSRPGFRFVRHVTIGVMFLGMKSYKSSRSEDRNRLRINRKLLKEISKMLRRAPNLRTVQLLWHDCIGRGDWEEKQTCLSSLAKLPEQVRCEVALGRESMAVHFPDAPGNSHMSLSIEEELAKEELNEYLEDVREEYQTTSQHKSPEGLENTSTRDIIE